MLAQQAAAAALEARQREEEAERKAQEEEERAAAAAAEREVQENLRAKMALFNSDDEEPVDDFFNDLAAENPVLDEPDFDFAEPIRAGPPQATNSLFERPEMNGKKIKVVSAASKRNGENSTTTKTTFTAPISTFTSVNKRSQAVDLSDSDSDDEIPASAPMPKKSVGRPRAVPTRGGMVPTRGGGTPKRGRGRPRKTM